MEFRILGPFEVSDGGAPVEVPRRKQRALLAALALRAGETLSTDRIVEDLWGESPPPRAVGSLQNTVSQLRRLLGPDVVVTRPPGYSLAIPREHVDLAEFERLVGEARAASPIDRAARLREALALWRGPPLADLAFEPFAALEVARLNELRVAAQEELVDAELALGHHRELVGEIESLVAEHPLRERLRGLLILALYRSGRQAEALEAYRRAREMLVEELGIDPSPELQRLEQAILRHDPELELEEAAAPLTEPQPAEHVHRKTVTVLFADLVDSTVLATSLDPEALQSVMGRYFDAARTVVESHGGTVEKFIGDAVAAVFGIPDLHEDDALRAVRAAQRLGGAIAPLSEELRREHGVTLAVRMGLSTGEVVVGDTAAVGALATGPAMIVAARLEAAALPGEILIGPETLELVRAAVTAEPVEPAELGGRAGTVQAFRVVSVDDEAALPARSLAAPLVAREAELARLREAFAAVRDERRSRVLTVLGEAGIGKTRLTGEFLASVAEEARALLGRCVPYGEGATYLPLASALRSAIPHRSDAVVALLAGDDQAEHVAQRVAEVMGEGAGGAPPGEIAWAVRRLLEALARERPLVLVVEDVHWAEPTLLDLIEYLGEWGSDAAVLVLCLARPDLLERRPRWSDRDALRLGPLSDAEAWMLVGDLVELPEADRVRIVDAAEGNPLFLEQLAAYARERDGALDRVPPSIEAVLASRLEGLDRRERRVLELAAVVGKDFSRAAVRHLSNGGDTGDIDGRLMSLIRRGLLRAGRVSAGAEDAIRFHHALVREVAYTGIPKESRAELHERLAGWLDGRPEGTDELIGYHLEQAHRNRAEVRPGDLELPRLANEAGRRLGEAGIRAWKRADAPAAINLLGRATVLLPPADAQRIEALCELGLALRIAGEYERAGNVLAEAISAAEGAGDRRLELRARLELSAVHLATEPEGASDELLELAKTAVPIFETFGDDRGLGRAWLLVGHVEGAFRCQNAAWQEAAERALVHYRAAGWPVHVGGLAAAMFHGPTPVPDAIRRCRRLLAEAAGGKLGVAQVELLLAGLEALRGRFAEAKLLAARAVAAHEELGAAGLSAQDAGPIRARIEALSGDGVAAESALRASCAELEKRGESASLATRRAQLADVVYSQGRYDEAESLANLAKRHAADDDLPTQFSWRAVLAKVRARRGAFEEAEHLGRAAVDLAEKTDALNQRAQVRLDLAEVLDHAGRSDEARALIEEATRLFHRKGNLVGARRARSLLSGLARERRGRPRQGALR